MVARPLSCYLGGFMKSLASVALAFLGACAVEGISDSLYETRASAWLETGKVLKPRAEILSTVRQAMVRQGYTIELSDDDAGRLRTGWVVQLSARFREGTRSMLEAEVYPLDGGGFNVRVRSWLDINNENKNPSMAEKATWIGAGQSEKHKDRIPDAAIKLQSLLKVRFFGLGS
jgi:hypothetical protein